MKLSKCSECGKKRKGITFDLYGSSYKTFSFNCKKCGLHWKVEYFCGEKRSRSINENINEKCYCDEIKKDIKENFKTLKGIKIQSIFFISLIAFLFYSNIIIFQIKESNYILNWIDIMILSISGTISVMSGLTSYFFWLIKRREMKTVLCNDCKEKMK